MKHWATFQLKLRDSRAAAFLSQYTRVTDDRRHYDISELCNAIASFAVRTKKLSTAWITLQQGSKVPGRFGKNFRVRANRTRVVDDNIDVCHRPCFEHAA